MATRVIGEKLSGICVTKKKILWSQRYKLQTFVTTRGVKQFIAKKKKMELLISTTEEYSR